MTEQRQRARELGIEIGSFQTGTLNAITDVPGVRVGQVTIDDGADLHTGVTAIVPDALLEGRHLPAGLFVGNGYGKLIGVSQLEELGEIETPILLTGTLSAFRVSDALISWLLDQPAYRDRLSINPIVGETNDGYLSDIRRRPISESHVREALDSATPGPVAEGCVGAGAGTTALGFKAGIGTSSRLVPGNDDRPPSTVGVLVQANFGGTLTVMGTPIPAPAPLDEDERGNSCMIVVATDAALDARQLRRIATRAVFAMGRVGASFSHGSGDYGIAFSVATSGSVPDRALDPLFAAVQDATEEALLNSLCMAVTTVGYQGHRQDAVSLELVRAATNR